jgi:hypothetical protein
MYCLFIYFCSLLQLFICINTPFIPPVFSQQYRLQCSMTPGVSESFFAFSPNWKTFQAHPVYFLSQTCNQPIFPTILTILIYLTNL